MATRDLYKIYIDTGAFIALLDETDTYHKEATAFYRSLTNGNAIFTSLLIISETYTWLRYHSGYAKANRFIEIVDKLTSTGGLRLVVPDSSIISKSHAVLQEFHDQDLSYADALSFVLLELYDIHHVFGFDSHFYIIKRNLWPNVKRKSR